MPDKRLAIDATYLSSPLRVAIDESTSGDNTVVAGESGYTLVVYSIFVMATDTCALIWKSGSTALTGAHQLAATGGYHIESVSGILETADGEDLVLNLSANTQVGGVITYGKHLIPTV